MADNIVIRKLQQMLYKHCHSLTMRMTLKCFDCDTFEIDEEVLESQTIKHMIEGNCADTLMDLTIQNIANKSRAKKFVWKINGLLDDYRIKFIL